MIIKLVPQRRDDTLQVEKTGNMLTVNGEECDLIKIQEGDTLPRSAIASEWFAGPVEMVDGELIITLLLPLPVNYSPEQAFPVDLVGVPDGTVAFPQPLPAPEPEQADHESAGKDADFIDAEYSEQQAIEQEKAE